ncbi:chromosomal replication initiator DnaA [Acetobacter sp. AN02]|uniref:chromosomal replication initiator DnaA n=1 Tax=Acetobacter sp. AN02 TaxID=2894186 RepID=UPI0024344525|nr:chromosomal replication initiator DnaA [Acetobacter sp. AN02]MDG6094444.1 chromosomal replication initiator DnaA [Acetobacter sp. AN02]
MSQNEKKFSPDPGLPVQIPLAFRRDSRFTAGSFMCSEQNAEAREWLSDNGTKAWPEGRLLVTGPAGSGKTHLVHLWAERQGAAYLKGAELDEQAVLSLEHMSVVLDDADQTTTPQITLHLINLMKERGGRLLLAARSSPSGWPGELPDLDSRIRATSAIILPEPDDVFLRRLMLRLCADRQMTVPNTLTEWLLLNLPREAEALLRAVDLLERRIQERGRLPDIREMQYLFHTPDDAKLSYDRTEASS